MRTLLIAGGEPVPPRLRELVDRGSTSVREQRSVDPATDLSSDFDRVVIWAPRGDTALRSLAQKSDNSRHSFDTQPAARAKEGAFGAEAGPKKVRRQPGTETARSGKAAALRRVK